MRLGDGDIRLLVVACRDGDHPRPEAIREAASLSVYGDIDLAVLDELVGELEEELRPDPFELDVRLSHFSWGADGAFVEILIGVTAGVLGNRLDRLIEVLRRRSREEHENKRDADDASRMARAFVARAREVDEESTVVERVDERSSSYLVTVAVSGGDRFEVEVPIRGGVSRFYRL